MDTTAEPALRKLGGYVEGFLALLPTLGIALVVFAAFMVAAWAANRSVAVLLARRGRVDLGILLGGFAKWVVLGFGMLVVSAIVFPSVKPVDLLATLGIGSVAIGFAFKDILQNWLSGILILYRQPFRKGDQIRTGEFEGTIEAIEARATVITTYDGQRVVVPNTDIYTRAVTVRTAFAKRRSEYDVGIGYGDDIDRACEVILRALAGVRTIESDPIPQTHPWLLDGSSVNIRVFWWTASENSRVVQARGDVILAIRRALQEAAIDLPFPTRVVLFHDQTEEADGDRARQREGWPASDAPTPPRLPDQIARQRDAAKR